MLKIYYRILISAWKTFGFGVEFLRWLLLFPLYFLLTRLKLFLDRIFFPQYRKIELKKPVFLLGGRSGTTFLHRLLNQTEDFAAYEAWQIIFPALTARILVKPLIKYLIKNNRSEILPSESGHEVHLNTVEEEELLFLHQLDTTFLSILTPLGFDEREYPELRLHDLQQKSHRQTSVKYFKGCLQRQILYTGKTQVVSKLTYSILRIKSLIEAFPDAKLIFLMRSPLEAVPSYLSLSYQLIDNQWGIKNIPPDKLKIYFRRIYFFAIELYSYFYKLHKNQEIPPENLLIIDYDCLKTDLEKTLAQIFAFTGIEPSERLQRAIRAQAQIQNNYRRQHKVIPLEKFGITREQIAKDFSFMYEDFQRQRKEVGNPTGSNY